MMSARASRAAVALWCICGAASHTYGSTYSAPATYTHIHSAPVTYSHSYHSYQPTTFHHVITHHVIEHPYTTYHRVVQHHTVSHPYTTYHKEVQHHTVSHPYTTYHKEVQHHTEYHPYTVFKKVAHHNTISDPYTTYKKIPYHTTSYHPYTTYKKTYDHKKVYHPYTTYKKVPHHHTVAHPYTTYATVKKHKLIPTAYTAYKKQPVYKTVRQTYQKAHTYNVPKTTYQTKYHKKYSYHKCEKYQRLKYKGQVVEGAALALFAPTPAPEALEVARVCNCNTGGDVCDHERCKLGETVCCHPAPQVVVQHHTQIIHHWHTYTPKTYPPSYAPTYAPAAQEVYAYTPPHATAKVTAYEPPKAAGVVYAPTYAPTEGVAAASYEAATEAAYEAPKAAESGYGRRNLRSQNYGVANVATTAAYEAPAATRTTAAYEAPAAARLVANDFVEHTVQHEVTGADFEAQVSGMAPTCPQTKVTFQGLSNSKQVTCTKRVAHRVAHTVEVPKTVFRPHVVTHRVKSYKEVPYTAKSYKKVAYTTQIPHHHVATHDVVTYKEVPEQHIATHYVTHQHVVPEKHVATKDELHYKEIPEQHIATHDVVTYTDEPEHHMAKHDVVTYKDVPEHHLATHDVVTYKEVPEHHVATHDVVTYHDVAEHHVAKQLVTQVATVKTSYHVGPVIHQHLYTSHGKEYGSDTGSTGDKGYGSDTGSTGDKGYGSDTGSTGDKGYGGRRKLYGNAAAAKTDAALGLQTVAAPAAAAYEGAGVRTAAAYETGVRAVARTSAYGELGLKVANARDAYGTALQVQDDGVTGQGTVLSQWPAHMKWSNNGNYLNAIQQEFGVVKHLVCEPRVSVAYKCPSCNPVKEARESSSYRRLNAHEGPEDGLTWESLEVDGKLHDNGLDMRTHVYHHVYIHKKEATPAHLGVVVGSAVGFAVVALAFAGVVYKKSQARTPTCATEVMASQPNMSIL